MGGYDKMKRWTLRLIAGLLTTVSLLPAMTITGHAAKAEALVGYRGDVDGDMRLTGGDVIMLSQYLLGTIALPDTKYADIDGNGVLTASDLTLLKRVLLMGESPEPVYQEIIFEDPTPDERIPAPVKALNPSLPSTGEVEVLMFTVNFPDCQFTEGYSSQQVWELAFGPENPQDPAYPMESITAYYSRASYGMLHVNGEVYEYTAQNSINSYIDNTDALVEEVLRAFDAQLDYTKYDVNRNGEMDTLILALPGTADKANWWPCSGGYYGWQRFDEVRASNLLIGGWSLSDRSGFNSTWIHEMGHGMGLPDYYKYENYEGDECYGLNGDAGWMMMDDALADMSCFDKLMYGWYDEDHVMVYDGGTKRYTLTSSQQEANCILIPRVREDGYYSEYFMIEYATHEGNNATWWLFRDGGIRVLHCQAEICEGWWGPEFKWNNYGMYYDTSNEKQRVLRLVNDYGGFFRHGDVISDQTEGFRWYDENGDRTVETNLTITVEALPNGEYRLTITDVTA